MSNKEQGVNINPQVDMELLSQAMDAFNSATVKLQSSYEVLQEEARKLREEIEEKNTRLSYMSNLLESVLNNTRSAILVVDGLYKVAVKNTAAERMLEDLGEAAVRDMLMASPDEGLFDYESQDNRFFRLSVGELNTDTLRGTVFVIDEITTLKQFEREKQRGEQLQMMGEMVANIAHEIRNPLGSIELFASLLERDYMDSPDARRLTTNIVKAVRTMNGVISNTLLFTKELHIEKQEYVLSDIVDDVVLYLQHTLRAKRVSILNRLDEGHTIWCDRALFHQVAMNLIHNAIDAVAEGEGEVELISDDIGTALRFSVRDNGSGLLPSMRSKLFMPFQTTKAKGTGLGLSIAYKIVKAHGGDITVDSDGETYTNFTVIMPKGA